MATADPTPPERSEPTAADLNFTVYARKVSLLVETCRRTAGPCFCGAHVTPVDALRAVDVAALQDSCITVLEHRITSARAAEKRVAELEAEVGRYRRWLPLLDVVRRLRDFGSIRTDADQIYDAMDRITGLRLFREEGSSFANVNPHYVRWQDQPELMAQSPTPPAPEARENRVHMGSYDSLEKYGTGHPSEEPGFLKHLEKRGAKSEAARVVSKEEKPPEAEEPAIVQTIRLVAQAPGSERCVTLEPEDARELLAFIDSRKAAPT